MADLGTREADRPCILQHRDAARATVGYLCDHHLAMVRETLTDILEFVAILPWFTLPGSMPDSDDIKRTKKPDAEAPIRLDVAALTDRRNGPVVQSGDIPDIPGVLAGWVNLVVEERTLDYTGVTVTENCRFLQRHNNWIAQQPWLDEYWLEIRNARRVLAQAVGHQDPKPIGKCPVLLDDGKECSTNLYADPDTGSVKCRHCHSSWSGRELVRLRLMQEAG